MELRSIDIELLKIARKADIKKMSLRQLGRLVNDMNPEHPQTIKYHLEKLEKQNLLNGNGKAKGGILLSKIKQAGKLFKLPILGSANCGLASVLAEENVIGYLRISPRLLERKIPDGLFVVKAIGDSLNQAYDVPGGPIENGDYVIVDSNEKEPQDGAYVLSVIDGMANLKRYRRKANQIILKSESSESIPPIYVHEEEKDEFLINGTVVRVMKSS